MKNLSPSVLSKYKNNTLIVVYFVLGIFITVYLFPNERKFRYEYQKGSPWLHENMMAPYDFAIYKLNNELEQERDSLSLHFVPYFRLDSTVVHDELDVFSQRFDTTWKFFLTDNAKYSRLDIAKESKIAEELFLQVYNRGVIELGDVLEQTDKDANFMLITQNLSDEYTLSEVYTLREAYEHLVKGMRRKLFASITDTASRSAISYEFIRWLGINEFLRPNILYDRETSSKLLSSQLNNISLTRGMVQSGEVIISKGEVINTDKYRILESLRREYEANTGERSNTLLVQLGHFIFVAINFGMLFIFFKFFRPEIVTYHNRTLSILLLVLITVIIASIMIRFHVLSIYLIPFTIVPVIIRTFYDSRTALFVHLITSVMVGFLAPNGFEFIFLQFIAGIIAVVSLFNVHRRKHIFVSSTLIAASYIVSYFGLAIVQEGAINKIEWLNFVWFGGSAFLLLISYPLIYIYEKMFGFLSDLTLLELSDSNQPLLRKLAEQAPGTFQHSMQVANLAEEAIYRIGGNPLLVRTGALYHDIGKMFMPMFFIENQVTGVNPHEELEPEKSAEVIISHVTKGIELAKKHDLPEKIIDFIRTHHGRSKVQYFYKMYQIKHPDEEVDVTKFTYPGPLPYSRETAVLMMADSVEAASRSLKSYSVESITGLVEGIINYQIQENQFINAPITFNDVSRVKALFIDKLKNIYHARIEYPK